MRETSRFRRSVAALLTVTILVVFHGSQALAVTGQYLRQTSITGNQAIESIRRETRPRMESRMGNSVDTATGAFILDIPFVSVTGGRSLDFNLHYNSLLTQNRGLMGYGWTTPFEAFLEGNTTGAVTVHWDQSQENRFQYAGPNQDFTPLDEAVRYDRLFRRPDNDWRLIRQDGSVYEFSAADGSLLRMGNKVEQYLVPHYFNGRMTSVEEPISGRRLYFYYTFGGLLETIQDSTDFQQKRIYHITYGPGDLISTIHSPVTLGDEYGTCCPNVDIPDNDPNGLDFTVQVTESGPIGLTQISTGSISHARLGDLEVTLTSPQGTQLVLFNQIPMSVSTLDFGGKVTDAFYGENPQGTWHVHIVDKVPGTSGKLSGWALRFSGPTKATHFIYQGRQIVRSTDAMGDQISANTYDGQGRVATQDDGISTNQIATFQYQDLPDGGVRTSYRNRVGDTTTVEHDSGYHLRSITDALGNTSTWEYDSDGNRIRATDALGHTTHFGYDDNGNLTSFVDPAGNTTTFEYVGDGNLISVRDALGKETRFNYDPNNNLKRITDALGNEDNKSYNGNSQLTGNLLAGRGGINMTYAAGLPKTASHPAESGHVGMDYDAQGRMTSMTDMDGYTRTVEYSPTDQITKQTDAIGDSVTSEYDYRDRLTRKTDAKGNQTQFQYDGNDNRISMTDALGRVTHYVYDGEDRLIRTTDPAGHTISLTYDALGRVVGETDALGHTATHEYDAVGNEVATYDAQGNKIRAVEYDSRNFPVRSRDAFGQASTLEYDALGRLTATVDAMGRRTQYGYDALDRPTSVQDPSGRVSSKTYWADDFVKNIIDPKGNETEFRYDQARRPSSVQTQLGTTTQFQMDKRDLLTQVTRPSGSTYNYTYDEVGRVTRFSTGGPGLIVPDIYYDYDENGNVTTVSTRGFDDFEPVPRLVRTYDALDRMTSYTDAQGNTVGYEYDTAGNLSALVYPDGKRVTYTYDAANRLIRISDWAGRHTDYTWNSNDLLTRVEFPNGTRREMDYDLEGRVLARRDIDSSGQLIVGYRYTYDAVGQINAEQVDGASPQAYQPQPVTMTYDSGNRLLSFNGQAPTFDADGNMTRGPLGNGFDDFFYDHKGNLLSAGNLSYSYNPEDQLVGFGSGNQRTNLVVSPSGNLSQVIQSTNPSGVKTYYVYGVGLVYEVTGSQVRVYHYDQRGSTTAFSGPSGTVTGRIDYGPFGEISGRSGSTDSLFLFCGMFGVITDPNGLNYMRYRWYSPQIKRFVNADAHYGDIALPDSLNRYAYTGNNPVMRMDPGGEFWNIVLGALIGAAASVAIKIASDAISGKKVDFTSGDYWAELGGAAIEGAVTGACLSTGVGIAGGAACGALGASAGYLTTQGIKGDQVDPGQLAFEAGVGAVAGGFAGGAARFARFGPKTAVGNRFTQFRQGFAAKDPLGFKLGLLARDKAVMGSDEYLVAQILPKLTFRQRFFTAPGKAVGKALARRTSTVTYRAWKGGEKLSKGAGFIIGNALFDSSGGGGSAGAAESSAGIQQSGWNEVSAGHKGVFGEFIHYHLYISALRAAGRPIPDNPNNVLATF
ncbi:MAG: proprotein convertase P-domain-containing protein [Acidobacteriota bacterium]